MSQGTASAVPKAASLSFVSEPASAGGIVILAICSAIRRISKMRYS